MQTEVEKLETMLGKHNETCGHQIENDLVALNPINFYWIQGYLSRFKSLTKLVENIKLSNL